MSLKGHLFRALLIASFGVTFSHNSLCAQDGAYTGFTPYSVFGLGQMDNYGSAYNRSMGGVGIASRNRKYVNYLNPASVTARDSLSFMTDFSMYHTSKIYSQNDVRNAKNATNINDIVMSFPIYRTLAVMMGIAPYSSTGYSFLSYLDDPTVLGKTNTVATTTVGQGTVNQLFVGAGVMFWKRLSLGAEYIHYFGDIIRENAVTFTDESYNGISSGYELDIKASTAKFGLQYDQPIGNDIVTVGATYTLSADMSGYIKDYQFSSGSILTDTLRYNVDTLVHDAQRARFASELGIGISYNHANRWRAELDYLRSDWSNCGMDRYGFKSVAVDRVFSATASESLRAGFEYTPNANDIRYYMRRCTYRIGAYHNKEYFRLNGSTINSTGITLGATLPVFNLNNGLTLGVDMGQRGSMAGGLVRERYVTFSVGLNAYDIWFQKHKYN